MTKWDNKTKKTFTDEERQIVEQVREYREKPMLDNAKSVFVDMEAGNGMFNQLKWKVDVKINTIKEFKRQKDRNKVQLIGSIWKHLEGYPDVKATKEDLELENERIDLMIKNAVSIGGDSVKGILSNMISYIGTKRLDKKDICTMEQYEEYVKTINEKLVTMLGYGVV